MALWTDGFYFSSTGCAVCQCMDYFRDEVRGSIKKIPTLPNGLTILLIERLVRGTS